MKNHLLLTAVALCTATLHAAAQGSLTPPPGAPAPVMKSLDQVEARTPLVAGQPGVSIDSNGTITISQPGSYYLTGNRTLTAANADGIDISSSDVMLDLNGFSLRHITGSGGDAVSIDGSNVSVRNGTIRGGTTVSGSTFTYAGWASGISANPAPNLVVENISVLGVRIHGIYLYFVGSRIERCSTYSTGLTGLAANSVSFSSARKAGQNAILSTALQGDSGIITDCFGESVGNGVALQGANGLVENSVGIAVGNAIVARAATNCSGTSTSGYGIYTTATATNCVGSSTSGIGLDADVATNCHGSSSSGAYGMDLAGTASFCRGTRSGGTAIRAGLAIGCTTSSSTGTILATISKQLGTP